MCSLHRDCGKQSDVDSFLWHIHRHIHRHAGCSVTSSGLVHTVWRTGLDKHTFIPKICGSFLCVTSPLRFLWDFLAHISYTNYIDEADHTLHTVHVVFRRYSVFCDVKASFLAMKVLLWSSDLQWGEVSWWLDVLCVICWLCLCSAEKGFCTAEW